MKRRYIPLLVLMVAVWVAPANAISISNDALIDQVISPLQGAESAAKYYRYNKPYRWAATPRFGTESNTAFFWLFENTNTGVLSLNMVFDRHRDGSGGAVSLDINGVPNTASVMVSNDRRELRLNRGNFRWVSSKNDGGVINRINGFDIINLALNNWRGIDNFYFLSGNARNPTRFLINPNEAISVNSGGGTEVPEPGSLILLGAGLVGLARRRRKII